MTGVCFKCERPAVLPGHNICALCHDEDRCGKCNPESVYVPASSFPHQATRVTAHPNRVVPA